MKRFLLASTFLVVAAPAFAANTALTLWNSTNPGGAETATGTDSAIISGSSLGGITIQTSGAARLTVPNNSLTESNLFLINNTGVAQTLDIIAGANGYLGPDNLFNASATILSASGVSELLGQFFVDPSNAVLGNGTNTGPIIGTQVGGTFDSGPITGPFSFSSNSADVPFSVSGPFGMAEFLQVTLQPGAFIGVQSISMDAINAVPEPKTWAMLGIGFAFMGALGFVRSRKGERLATFA